MVSFGFSQIDSLSSKYIPEFDGPDTLIIIDTDPIKHYSYALDMNNPFALSNVRIGPLLFDGSHGLPIGEYSILAQPNFLTVDDSIHTITSFHYVGYADYLYRDLGITAKKITSSGVEMIFYGSGKGYRPLVLNGLEEGLYSQNYLASISKDYGKGKIRVVAINHIEGPGYVVAYSQEQTSEPEDDLYYMKGLNSHMWGLDWKHQLKNNLKVYFRNSYHYTSKESYVGNSGTVQNDSSNGYDMYQSQWIDTGLEYIFSNGLGVYFKSFLDIYNYDIDINSELPDYNFSVKKNQIGAKYKFGKFSVNTSIDYIGYRYNESWAGPSNMLKRGGYEIKYEDIYFNNLKVSVIADRKNFGTLAYGTYLTGITTGGNDNTQNISVIRHYIDNLRLSILKNSTMIGFDFGRIEWEDRRYSSIGYFDIPFHSFHLEHKKENFRAKIFYKKFNSPEYRTHPVVSDESNFSSFMPLIDLHYSYNIYYSFKVKEKYRFKNFIELNGKYSHFTGDASINRYSDFMIEIECDQGCFDGYTHVINLSTGLDFGDFILTFNYITNDGGKFAAFNSNEEIFPIAERNFLGQDLNAFYYVRVDWKFKD